MGRRASQHLGLTHQNNRHWGGLNELPPTFRATVNYRFSVVIDGQYKTYVERGPLLRQWVVGPPARWLVHGVLCGLANGATLQ